MKGLRLISHCIYKGNYVLLRAEFKPIPPLFFLTGFNTFGVQNGVHFLRTTQHFPFGKSERARSVKARASEKRIPKVTTFGAGLGWREAQNQTKRLNLINPAASFLFTPKNNQVRGVMKNCRCR